MILPGATLGVLGGGQLGRMFTAEAKRMGYRVVVVDPDPDAPAAQLADIHISRPWTDPDAMQEVAERCAAVTTEFENVPAEVLRALAAHVPVRPGADAVALTQDRIVEKTTINDLGIATAAWTAVTSVHDLPAAWDGMAGGAAILKTARLGYDGKGQVIVRTCEELANAFDRFERVACILERQVALEREISVLVARSGDGNIVTWPVAENVHRNGILHTSVVPAAIPDAMAAIATEIARQIAGALDYVGVLCVECFVTVDGKVLVNELAPRPHNSGHWTLDACMTSQFEQQVRCLAGLPLGNTCALMPSAMVNLLGDLWAAGEPRWDRVLEVQGVRLHLYGKREPRPGRKMGHLTAVAGSGSDALALVTMAFNRLL